MATNRLGVLTIDLIAKTGGFEEGMDKAARRAKRFGDQMDQTENRVVRAARSMRRGLSSVANAAGQLQNVAIAAGAATAAIVVLAANTAEMVKQAQLVAQTFGTTTQQLLAFQYAAQRVGVESEKAGDILKDMLDKLGDAARTGGGELAPILDKLGLSAARLASLRPIEALREIGDAISDLPKAQQVFVMEAMADEASRLLPLLRDNSRALKQLSEFARQTNIAPGEDEIRTIIRAGQAVDKLTGIFVGLKNTLVVAVAPVITGMANAFSLQLTESLQANQKEVVDWGGVFGDVVAFTADASVAAIATLSYAFKSLGNTIAATMAQLQALISGDFERIGTIQELYLENQEQILDNFLSSNLTRFRDALDKARKAANDTTSTLFTPFVSGGTVDRSGGGTGGVGSIGSTSAGFQQATTQFGVNVGDYYAAIMDSISGFNRNIKQESQDTFKSLTEYAQEAARNIQDALANFLFDPFSEGLDGMLRGFADTIRRMAAEAASARLLSALFGNQFVGGQSQQMGGFLGNLFAGFFANGGSIPSGQFGIAGEAGPELITGPATVTPMKGMGGNVYVNVVSEMGGEVETEQREVSDGVAIDARIKRVVNEDLAVRGSVSKSLQTAFPQLRRTGAT